MSRFGTYCIGFLCLLVIYLSSCTNHRKQWAGQVDSLRLTNAELVKSVNDASLRGGLKTIKVESGSRLILLDRYQGSLPVDSQVSPLLQYAKIHKQAQTVDDHLDRLSMTLQQRTDALKNLRTDIESGAWKKDSVLLFIEREKGIETKIQAEIEKSLEKAYDLKAEFDSLHPFMVRYTDSLLQIRI